MERSDHTREEAHPSPHLMCGTRFFEVVLSGFYGSIDEYDEYVARSHSIIAAHRAATS